MSTDHGFNQGSPDHTCAGQYDDDDSVVDDESIEAQTKVRTDVARCPSVYRTGDSRVVQFVGLDVRRAMELEQVAQLAVGLPVGLVERPLPAPGAIPVLRVI